MGEPVASVRDKEYQQSIKLQGEDGFKVTEENKIQKVGRASKSRKRSENK